MPLPACLLTGTCPHLSFGGVKQAHEKWKTISNTHVSVMSVFVTTDLEWKAAGSVYFVQIRDTRSGKRSKLRALFVGTSVACGIKF